jgi:hypothetical protein
MQFLAAMIIKLPFYSIDDKRNISEKKVKKSFGPFFVIAFNQWL